MLEGATDAISQAVPGFVFGVSITPGLHTQVYPGRFGISAAALVGGMHYLALASQVLSEEALQHHLTGGSPSPAGWMYPSLLAVADLCPVRGAFLTSHGLHGVESLSQVMVACTTTVSTEASIGSERHKYQRKLHPRVKRL